MHHNRVCVFQEINIPYGKMKRFKWFREGSPEERRLGKHIVVQDIISYTELQRRLNQN